VEAASQNVTVQNPWNVITKLQTSGSKNLYKDLFDKMVEKF